MPRLWSLAYVPRMVVDALCVPVTARLYDWCVAFCWSFGIGRDLSTPTSWAPTERWPGERHLCFPSYREYKTRQRALWIADTLQNTIGPDYMNTIWRFRCSALALYLLPLTVPYNTETSLWGRAWLSHTRVPLSAPREHVGTIELQSEKECLACLAPPKVRIAGFAQESVPSLCVSPSAQCLSGN